MKDLKDKLKDIGKIVPRALLKATFVACVGINIWYWGVNALINVVIIFKK